MKKLIVLFVTIFCGTLFAAAEGDAGASLPPQRISHPLTGLPVEIIQGFIFPHLSDKDQQAFRSLNWEAHFISPRALTFNMQSVEGHEISRVSNFLADRKDIKTLKITHLKAPVLILALTSLRDEGFRFSSLIDLDLMDNTGIIPVLENIIPLAPNLMGLNVVCCRLGVGGPNLIRQMMPHLKTLDIGRNRLGDAGAAAIAQMPHLTELNIEYNRMGPVGAVAIAQMPHLTTLNIEGNFIGVDGANAVAQMPNLTNLHIGSNDIGDAGAVAIAQMPNLVQLSICRNYIEDAGAAAIAQMHHLRSLNIRDNDIGDPGATAIAQMPQLTDLNIEENHIGSVGTISIAQMPHLRTLRIGFNNIGCAGVEALNYLDQTRPIKIYS